MTETGYVYVYNPKINEVSHRHFDFPGQKYRVVGPSLAEELKKQTMGLLIEGDPSFPSLWALTKCAETTPRHARPV
jgi:hypothetical protein